jgi:hypothetical protein
MLLPPGKFNLKADYSFSFSDDNNNAFAEMPDMYQTNTD